MSILNPENYSVDKIKEESLLLQMTIHGNFMEHPLKSERWYLADNFAHVGNMLKEIVLQLLAANDWEFLALTSAIGEYGFRYTVDDDNWTEEQVFQYWFEKHQKSFEVIDERIKETGYYDMGIKDALEIIPQYGFKDYKLFLLNEYLGTEDYQERLSGLGLSGLLWEKEHFCQVINAVNRSEKDA